ncbi:hypothetical protein C8A01DRAFT_48680 [Parachaetomium inaequale]|uniref:Uncharacterized protein n=1 Tax=Parachaetomium inaequale TaxID=2588326 RepID=A0AAN6SPA0_9PEZI|nr:hypothetical protein C8A01DRAFT_48680 [Parachaetomium inaequale]
MPTTQTPTPHLPLPRDITTDILTRSLSCPPACALALLCPDWSLCRRRNPALEAVLRTTRVDTYTLPLDSTKEKGIISTTFDHAEADHIGLGLPCMRDPREKYGPRSGMPRDLRRELVRRWVGGSVVAVSQREEPMRVGPLWGVDLEGMGEGVALLREERAVGLLPYEDDLVVLGRTGRVAVCGVDWREKEALPPSLEGGEGEYLYERMRHLVVNSVLGLAEVEAEELGLLPGTWCAQTRRNLLYLQDRLEYERVAHLRLRWGALERLETLALDLRGYSLPTHGYFYDADVVELARSLQGKGLKLLVIAGLRSWRFYPGFEPADIAEAEGGKWDPTLAAWVSEKRGRGINWFKMFKGALRPGGRLVFVDKSNGKW